jgi:hypothetical protein
MDFIIDDNRLAAGRSAGADLPFNRSLAAWCLLTDFVNIK